MPCFTYEAQWSTYYLPGIPTGKQCLTCTRTQFACWGKIPNPQDQNFVLAAHLKNASLSAQNKTFFDADRICCIWKIHCIRMLLYGMIWLIRKTILDRAQISVEDQRGTTMIDFSKLTWLILVNVPVAASQIFSGFGESRGGKNLSLRNSQSRIEPYYRYRWQKIKMAIKKQR